MKTGRFFVLGFAAALAASALSPGARAQSAAEVAMADGLFNQGVKLLEQKKYAEACDMLERSRKLAVGLGVTLYLADCQEKNGKPASALVLFREAEKMAAARKDPRQEVARDHADKLEKSVPHVTLRVSADVAAARQEVILDGRRLDQKEWGQPIMVDPGAHKVRSMAEDGNAWESEVTVASGANVALDIPLLRPASAGGPTVVAPPVTTTTTPAPAAPPQPDTPASNPDATGRTQRTIGLIVAGAGVVGLGVGTVFGLSAKSKQSDADAHCNAADKCDPTGLDLRQSALGAATLSTVFFAVGAVAVAGGAVVYLTAPKAARTMAIVPAATPNGAGLFAHGSF